MTQPSRIIFWRSVLFITGILPFLAIWNLIHLANELNVIILKSNSWMGFLSLLGFGGFSALLALTSTYLLPRERVLSLLEIPTRIRRFGFFLIALSIAGYTIAFTFPYSRDLLGGLGWMRFLIFWFFTLVGMYGLKAIKDDYQWLTSLLIIVLFQTLLHLVVTQLLSVTSYPFAMGWSETSRYYYPSLFLSEKIYGVRLPWPILHPSLHLLLAPPYIVDAPLWFYRMWQVFLRFALLGLTAQMIIWRLALRGRAFCWFLWVWMLLYLFQGPIYFHLTIPLILMLWGFSAKNDHRTWIFLILASVWSGLSRINWYPMPGLLASALFLLEVPYQGNRFWRYITKPTLWFLVGFAIAFITQRAYITLSGIPDPDFFYTSLTSNLLWYRLFPNASYSVGILPAAIIASVPLWGVIHLTLRKHRTDFHPLRLGLIFAVLSVLFVGGLLVSLKIGGGVDIHNLDAYLGLLLIVTTYFVFRRYTPEKEKKTDSVKLHWCWVILLIAAPAWFLLQSNGGIKSYDLVHTEAILKQLQIRVDTVNDQGGEILFITQRHLISMHMLEEILITPEYEREELMEMAMGNNREYLQGFRTDMEKQRFSVIVVDPLSYRLLGKNYAFGEENNAWVRRIMKPILCNYREDVVFPADQIAVYIPQNGTRQCP